MESNFYGLNHQTQTDIFIEYGNQIELLKNVSCFIFNSKLQISDKISTNDESNLSSNRGHNKHYISAAYDELLRNPEITNPKQESKQKKVIILWCFDNIERERKHINRVEEEFPECETKEIDYPEACKYYLKDVGKDTEVILITSGGFGIKLKDEMIKNSTIKSVFIFCLDLEFHKKWADKIRKIKKVTDTFDDIMKTLVHSRRIEMWSKDMLGKLELKQMLNIFESCNYYIYNYFIYHFFEEKKFNLYQAKEDFKKYCSINYKGETNLVNEFDAGKLEENILDYYMQDNSFLEMINNSWIRGDYYALFKLRYAIYLLKREMNNKLVCTKENYPKVLYRVINNKENLEEFLQLKNDEVGFLNDSLLLRGFVSFTSINPEKKTDSLYEELGKFSILFRITIDEKDLPNVHPYPCGKKNEFLFSDNIILKIISREKSDFLENTFNYFVNCVLNDIQSEKEYYNTCDKSFKSSSLFDEKESDDNFYFIKLNNLTKKDDLTLKILNEVVSDCQKSYYGTDCANKNKDAIAYLTKALELIKMEDGSINYLEKEISGMIKKIQTNVEEIEILGMTNNIQTNFEEIGGETFSESIYGSLTNL